MNRKSMFFSLSALVLIIFLFIIFRTKGEIAKIDEDFNINRAQVIVMDQFVRDFDRYHIPQILETSAKQALVKRTSRTPLPFPKDELADIMKDGKSSSGTFLEPALTTDANFEQALGTLTFKLVNDDRTFEYSLRSVKQLSFDTLQLNFSVSYNLQVAGNKWFVQDKTYLINVNVYSMWHPSHSNVIDDLWIPKTDAGCYADLIISNSEPCSGLDIMPLPT